MKTLAIIGGGQHGVVVAEIAEATEYTVKGFLDDTIPAGTEISGYKVLGKTELCRNLEQGTEFVIAVGNNATRKAIAENYSDLHWATLIHPSAVVSVLKHDGVKEGAHSSESEKGNEEQQ